LKKYVLNAGGLLESKIVQPLNKPHIASEITASEEYQKGRVILTSKRLITSYTGTSYSYGTVYDAVLASPLPETVEVPKIKLARLLTRSGYYSQN